MRSSGRYVAALALVSLAGAGVAILLAHGGKAPVPVTAVEYVGDQACLTCHQEQGSFLETAHHLTSRPATAGSIAGSFRHWENVLGTSNPYLHYRMEARPEGLFQTAVVGMPPGVRTHSERIDLVIGSGRKGQSYLSWQEHQRLVQLPVSYWTSLDSWINSPGYREGVPTFGRPVTPRCLECHSTFARVVPDEQGALNRYDPASFILGVGCEKCHGPGREHVERATSWTARLLGQAIVNPAELPRDGQVDVCSLCHAGVGEARAPAFSFVPGEPIESYLQVADADPKQMVDVHGNQVALLKRSSCFQQSGMTCSTCHTVHQPQRDAAAFSSACLTCHQVQSCGLFPERGATLAENCVDCHMPELPSNEVISAHQGQAVRPRVRTHWIRVWPGTAGPQVHPVTEEP